MIQSAKTFAARFWKDESGATMMEYTILIALITIAVVTAITNVGDQIIVRWQTLLANLS